MTNIPQPSNLGSYKPMLSGIPALFYGAAGSGKTELAATAGSDTLIVNTGKGMATLLSPGFRSRHPKDLPDIVDISETISDHGYVKSTQVYDLVCDVIDDQLKKNHDKYRTIVLDDLTSLRRSALIKGMEINQASGRSQSANISKTLKLPIKSVQDYGIEMDLIAQFISGYVEILGSLGINFVVLAHERVTYKKSDKVGEVASIQRIRPAVTGEKFPDDLPQYFDLIGYCYVLASGDKPVHKVKFSLDNIILAKNRWGGVKVNPDNPSDKETYDGSVTNLNLSKLFANIRLQSSLPMP